jgi:hypothetical protein
LAHLELDGGFGALLVGFGAPQQVGVLGNARFVGETVEQVPSKGNGGHPIGAAAGNEPLAVGSETGPETYLRQQRAARGINLGLRQILR